MRRARRLSIIVVGLFATIIAVAELPTANADFGWIAVASSPSHEALDWYAGASRRSAELGALRQCAALQNAADCRILASGPNCVAVVWDATQPLNRPHAVAADTSAAALSEALAAAGPFANDPTVRCSFMAYGPPPGAPPTSAPRQQML